MLDHKLAPKAVRRIEVITGPGGRRRFSDDEKARIIEEALMPGAVVSAVARQNGLTPATAVHLAAAGPAANGVGPG
jgi:transposase